MDAKFKFGDVVSWRGQEARVVYSYLSSQKGFVYSIELPTANRMMKFGIRESELKAAT